MIRLAGFDGSAVGFAAFERIGQRIEMQATFGLRAAMTFVAFGFQNRLHVFEVVDAALVRVLRLHAVDAGGDEMVDLVARGEVFRQFGHFDGLCLRQPGFCGLATLRPIWIGLRAEFGALLCIHHIVMCVAFLLVVGPTGVVVGNFAFASGDELPGLRALL